MVQCLQAMRAIAVILHQLICSKASVIYYESIEIRPLYRKVHLTRRPFEYRWSGSVQAYQGAAYK